MSAVSDCIDGAAQPVAGERVLHPAHIVRRGGVIKQLHVLMTENRKSMKLQIALDMVGLDEAVAILNQVGDFVDIVEVGTPWILQDGLKTVAELKKRFPRLDILADLKIIDAGKHEAAAGFAAGADIVTVMGVGYDETIAGALAAAKEYGGDVMVDLLATPDPATRAQQMQAMGVRYVCVHTAFDLQAAHDPLEELASVSHAVNAVGVAVAGGVKTATIPEIVKYKPSIVIVGGALTGIEHSAMRETAATMKEMLSHV